MRRRSSRSLPLRLSLLGALALGAIGSCELPKPQLPSIGAAPPAPQPATPAGGAAAGLGHADSLAPATLAIPSPT